MARFVGETYLSYLKRMTDNVSEGLIDYQEYGYELLSEDVYSSENWRKFFYIIQKILPLLEEDIDQVADEDQLRLLQLKEQDIYKASVQMRDQRRELRKWQTSEARYEHLVTVVKDYLQDFTTSAPVEFGQYRQLQDMKHSAVLMLSDWHAGALIDNQFNYYNPEVMEERAKQIFEKTIQYGILHNVRDLCIEINGDMIHGLINVSNRVQAEEDVVEQIVHVAKLLSELINGLVPYFGSIKVITTLGNHGRMHQDKSVCVTKENFEKLVTEILTLRLDSSIIVISAGAEDFTKYEIDNKIICVAHGQYDKIVSVVNDFTMIYQQVPSEIHLGHTHSFKDINDNNVMVTVNGSLQGTDDYALTLRKVTKPSQTLIIYGEDRCVYNLNVE